MILAVAVLGYAIVAGFKKAQDRAKQTGGVNRPAVVQPRNAPGRQNLKRPPAPADDE